MYSEDEEGFKDILESEVIGSYLLDVVLENQGEKCILYLSRGAFEFDTPYEVCDSNVNDLGLENLVGYEVEFVNDVWDDSDNDESCFEIVFDSGSKIQAFYVESSQGGANSIDNSGKDVNYTITYTSNDGDQFSAGMMYI